MGCPEQLEVHVLMNGDSSSGGNIVLLYNHFLHPAEAIASLTIPFIIKLVQPWYEKRVRTGLRLIPLSSPILLNSSIVSISAGGSPSGYGEDRVRLARHFNMPSMPSRRMTIDNRVRQRKSPMATRSERGEPAYLEEYDAPLSSGPFVPAHSKGVWVLAAISDHLQMTIGNEG